MTWLEQFPTLGDERLSSLRQTVDAGFLGFARDYGEALELMFKPLKQFLIGVEHLLSVTPWFVVLLGVLLVTIYATRSWKYTFWAVAAFIFIGAFGMWDNTMKTLATIWPGFTIVMKLLGYVGIAVVVLILVVIPQLQYRRDPEGYFLVVEDYDAYAERKA
jgi:ABC-type proline/glycine betaine transport system permease subunit